MSERFSVMESVSYDANHIRGMTTAGLFEFLGKLSVNADNAQAIGVCFREIKARFVGDYRDADTARALKHERDKLQVVCDTQRELLNKSDDQYKRLAEAFNDLKLITE